MKTAGITWMLIVKYRGCNRISSIEKKRERARLLEIIYRPDKNVFNSAVSLSARCELHTYRAVHIHFLRKFNIAYTMFFLRSCDTFLHCNWYRWCVLFTPDHFWLRTIGRFSVAYGILAVDNASVKTIIRASARASIYMFIAVLYASPEQ